MKWQPLEDLAGPSNTGQAAFAISLMELAKRYLKLRKERTTMNVFIRLIKEEYNTPVHVSVTKIVEVYQGTHGGAILRFTDKYIVCVKETVAEVLIAIQEAQAAQILFNTREA